MENFHLFPLHFTPHKFTCIKNRKTLSVSNRLNNLGTGVLCSFRCGEINSGVIVPYPRRSGWQSISDGIIESFNNGFVRGVQSSFTGQFADGEVFILIRTEFLHYKIQISWGILHFYLITLLNL